MFYSEVVRNRKLEAKHRVNAYHLAHQRKQSRSKEHTTIGPAATETVSVMLIPAWTAIDITHKASMVIRRRPNVHAPKTMDGW